MSRREIARILEGHHSLAKVRLLPQDAPWLCIDIEGQDMKRVNQHLFYQLAVNVHPLGTIEEGIGVSQTAWDLHRAKVWLEFMLNNELVALVVSRKAAEGAIEAIDAVIPQKTSEFANIDPERKYTFFEAYRIKNNVSEFETVFAAELATFDTYIVSKKGIYSTADLIERAEMAIDENVRDTMSTDVLNDFKQAGRCLAFELPTAAGFHTMRAAEAVLRNYWRLVLNPATAGKPPEMAVCIQELRAKGEDSKLMDILDHIRDLHRNTIMHPEAFLTMTEALRLFDIAKSAISAMGDRINALSLAAPRNIEAAASATVG